MSYIMAPTAIMRTPARSLDPQTSLHDAARQTSSTTSRPSGSLVSPQAFRTSVTDARATVPDNSQIEEALTSAGHFLTSKTPSSSTGLSGKQSGPKPKPKVKLNVSRVQKSKASGSAARPRSKVKAFKNLKLETQQHRRQLIAVVRQHWPEFDDAWPHFPNVPQRSEGEARDVRECSDAFLAKLAQLAGLCHDNIDKALEHINISLSKSKEPVVELNEQILSRTVFRLDEMDIEKPVDREPSTFRERSMTATAPPVSAQAPATTDMLSPVVPLASGQNATTVVTTRESEPNQVIDMTRSVSPVPQGSAVQADEQVTPTEVVGRTPVIKSEDPVVAAATPNWTRKDEIRWQLARKQKALEMKLVESEMMDLQYEQMTMSAVI